MLNISQSQQALETEATNISKTETPRTRALTVTSIPGRIGHGGPIQSVGSQVVYLQDAQRLRELRLGSPERSVALSPNPRPLLQSASVPHLLVKRFDDTTQTRANLNSVHSGDPAHAGTHHLSKIMLNSASAQRLIENPLPPPPQSTRYLQTLQHARRVLELEDKPITTTATTSLPRTSKGTTSKPNQNGNVEIEDLNAAAAHSTSDNIAAAAASVLQRDQLTSTTLNTSLYTVLAEENAELARALHARTAVLENVMQKLGMHLDRRVHIEEEVKRLGALVEGHNANARITGAELLRITETLSELKVERGELIAQSSAAVAETHMLKDRFEKVQAQLETLRNDLNNSQLRSREEARRAARLESDLVAANKELTAVQTRLRACEKEREELAIQRGKLESLALEAQAKERSARTEQRLMSETLAERRLHLLDVEAKVKQLKENEGKAIEALTRAQEDLLVQAQRSQLLHERAAAATVRAEELEQCEADLKEQLATALERARASETRASALETQLGQEVERSSAFSRELEESQTKLRAEAEARREAQIARVKAVRDQEKAKKSQTRLGTEYETLLRRYEQLKETSATLETALNEEKQQSKELESRLKDLNSTKDAYHQTLSELQRLTIRYQELQTVSNTQIMGLTDLRDRQAQQIELLRTKLHTVSEKLKTQTEETETVRDERDKLRSQQQALIQERDLMQRKVVSLTDSFGSTIAGLRTQIAELESQLREKTTSSISE